MKKMLPQKGLGLAGIFAVVPEHAELGGVDIVQAVRKINLYIAN